MAKSIMALVFPEYVDKGNLSTSYEFEWRDLFDDVKAESLIKELRLFIDFYEDEECSLMYDSQNAAAFSFVFETLNDCYPSRARQFRMALRNKEDWRKNRVSSDCDEYFVNEKSTIKDEIRSEIAARLFATPEDSFLIVVHMPGFHEREWILKREMNTCRVVSQPLSIRGCFKWLSHNRHPQRIYNWNPKHGEHGRGAHPEHHGQEVSVLLCSREHAAELLNIAVGTQTHDTLYCFDTEQGKFMEYKAERKQENMTKEDSSRSYHSYHLMNDSKIPKKVRQKLEILTDRKS